VWAASCLCGDRSFSLFALCASARSLFPLVASTGTTLLDIALDFGIIVGRSNDVAISKEEESEVLGA